METAREFVERGEGGKGKGEGVVQLDTLNSPPVVMGEEDEDEEELKLCGLKADFPDKLSGVRVVSFGVSRNSLAFFIGTGVTNSPAIFLVVHSWKKFDIMPCDIGGFERERDDIEFVMTEEVESGEGFDSEQCFLG